MFDEAADEAEAKEKLVEAIAAAQVAMEKEAAFLQQVRDGAASDNSPANVIDCKITGSEATQFMTECFEGTWFLSEESPVLEGLPHYERRANIHGEDGEVQVVVLHIYHMLDVHYNVARCV